MDEAIEEYNEDHVIRCPDCMSLVYPGRKCKRRECSEDESK